MIKPNLKKKSGTAVTPLPKEKLTFGGRPMGAKNKLLNETRFNIIQTLKEAGCDPALKLALAALEAEQNYLSTKKENLAKGLDRGQSTALQIMIDANYRLMEFVYPKLKAVEHTGKDGEDIFQSFTSFVKSVVDDSKLK